MRFAGRPRRGRRLSLSAALLGALGVGVLIGITLAFHLVQTAPERWVPRLETRSTPPVATPSLAETPAPPAEPDAAPQPTLALNPPTLSPRTLPRMAERPEPAPDVPGPNAAVAPPQSARPLLPPPPSRSEPVVLATPRLFAPDLTGPAWRRHAVRVSVPEGRSLIAILIDDAGLNRRNTARLAALQGPLTMAYMTYAENLERQSAAARAAGHELMLHLPMEPLDHEQNAGPNALESGLEMAELRRRLLWGLNRLEGYVGVNNHMGSRFTAWEPGMALVMEELKRRGLLFVDSRTIGDSLGARMAERYAVPHADRDVFLDNDEEGAAVADRLAELEAVARRRGTAIGIGHPHDETVTALAEWLPTLAAKGFALVPVSTIVERRVGRTLRSAATATLPPG